MSAGARIGAVALVVTAGCESAPSQIDPGLDLQVRVHQAQLRRGVLGGDQGGPRVSQVLRPQPAVMRGEATVELDGRLAPEGIALLLQAQGDEDHWVVAPDGFDFVVTDELLWDAQLEFSHSIARDQLVVNVQAVDREGRAGPLEAIEFTVLPDLPPSELLVSLGWDSPVDMDLYVELPDGTVVGPKNTNSNDAPVGEAPPPDAWMEGGIYAFDSNQQCRLDLRNRENVVWVRPPMPGRYRVYAHLFSPCDQAAVNTEVVVMRGEEVVERVGGTQYAFDSRVHPSNGEAPGLLMIEVDIE